MKLRYKIFSWMGLAVYTLLLFLLMTLYRLPADKLIAATVEDLTKGKLSVKVRRMSPAFPAIYRLEGVSYGISLGDIRVKDHLDSLIFRPDYKRLFVGYLPFQFRGTIQRGSIHGKTGVSTRSWIEDGYITIKISDIYLEDSNILRSFSDRDLRGKINGEIRVNGNLTDFTKINGEGHFHAEKGSINTKIDLPGMKAVPFESIKLAFSIKDGILALKDSEMDGPMFSGIFSGEVKLNQKIGESRLNITAEMEPGQLLKNHQLAGQFLNKIRIGNAPLVIKIGGTLEKPSIVWSKS